MTRKKDTAAPTATIERPRQGGSYVRAKDGTLIRREFTTGASIADRAAAVAPDPATPAEADTSNEQEG